MKLTIDLETIETWDDETLASVIERTIEDELKRFIKLLVKDALKEEEKQLRALVARASKQDLKKVGRILAQLQEENDA